MEQLTHHLQRLIKINRQIINRLNRDEASTEYMQEAFGERNIHISKISEIVPNIEKDQLTSEQKKVLKPLFDRFNIQSQKIQAALDTIIEEAEDRVVDASQRRKAEEGYQVLKQPNISYF